MTDQHHIALPAGYRLENFRLESVLGHGGFGITYRAVDEDLQQVVAIKEYLPREVAFRDGDATVIPLSDFDRETFEWGLERFLDEARTLARFRHPNIVGVRRFIRANGTAYLVMDYCEGDALESVLGREGTLDPERVVAMLVPLLKALEALHAAGVTHRDIKPGNIYLREDGSPVLLDFGAARQALAQHSRSVTAMATPGYAAFEQYSTKGKQGPWTDIYGLGATLYRCVTGDRPTEAPDRIMEDEMKPAVEAALQDYARPFLEKIDSALRPRPQDRPQSIAEWVVSTRGLTPQKQEPDEQGNLASLISRVARSDPDAQLELAERHANGKGVEQNFHRSLKWYQQAAEQGDSEVHFALGHLYEKGPTGAPDMRSAPEWHQRAGQQVHLGALDKVREEKKSIETLESDREPKSEERARGSPGIKGWLWSFVPVAALLLLFFVFASPYDEDRETRIAAENGNAEAQVELGLMYAEGREVTRDDAEAVRWYRLAAEQGNPDGQFNLGTMYRSGRGVARDHAEAVRWYRLAAEQGDALGQLKLGAMYEAGLGVAQNDAEAVRWYRLAARQGNPDGQFNLGAMYRDGRGVAQDDAGAVR